MTKFQNMKIEINEQQPLDDVVMELERLGYKPYSDDSYPDSDMRCIATYKEGDFLEYCHIGAACDHMLTTLAQLKAMEK